VCALCLGLGGKTGHMVRANRLSDFVLKGADAAEIEVGGGGWGGGGCCPRATQHPPCGVQITIQGGAEHGGDFVVSRQLSTATSGNRWLINGTVVGEATVMALLKGRFHIAMDNPCMFLPQEKVSSFRWGRRPRGEGGGEVGERWFADDVAGADTHHGQRAHARTPAQPDRHAPTHAA
jgi:chromosome segregation ATPase